MFEVIPDYLQDSGFISPVRSQDWYLCFFSLFPPGNRFERLACECISAHGISVDLTITEKKRKMKEGGGGTSRYTRQRYRSIQKVDSILPAATRPKGKSWNVDALKEGNATTRGPRSDGRYQFQLPSQVGNLDRFGRAARGSRASKKKQKNAHSKTPKVCSRDTCSKWRAALPRSKVQGLSGFTSAHMHV